MQSKKIILFDGVCNFCNFWVNFVMARDKRDLFRFAPLQSNVAKEKLTKYKSEHTKLESVILISDDKVYMKSTAALLISKDLSGPVKVLFPLIVIPKFLRDFIYDLIAKNRYKIFGKKDSCRIPKEEEKSKFLV